jgi:hypothetical protein
MSSLRISFGGLDEFSGGRAFADGLDRNFERKSRQMNARSNLEPRKAQVKDKGLAAESGDFGGWVAKFDTWVERGANE